MDINDTSDDVAACHRRLRKIEELPTTFTSHLTTEYPVCYIPRDRFLRQPTRGLIIRLGVYTCLYLAVYICSCCKGEIITLDTSTRLQLTESSRVCSGQALCSGLESRESCRGHLRYFRKICCTVSAATAGYRKIITDYSHVAPYY